MKMPDTLPRLKGYRFPREIVAYAVWAYHRFALSTGDVEDLLAERGVIVSRDHDSTWLGVPVCICGRSLSGGLADLSQRTVRNAPAAEGQIVKVTGFPLTKQSFRV
jgi:hypothetical protein